MKSLTSLMVANTKSFLRDRMGMFWSFAFPVFFVLIFGMVFSGSDEFQYNVGMVLEDNGAGAHQISDAFKQVDILVVNEGDRESQMTALKAGQLNAVVVIPSTMTSSIASGQTTNLEVYYDAAQTSTSQVVLSVLDKVVQHIDREITKRPVMLGLETNSIQTQQMKNIDYILPGILAMALMQLGIFATYPIISMRVKGVLKRLGATPLRRSHFITAHVAVRVMIAVVQTGIIILIGRLVFGVQMTGNWFALAGVVFLGALTFLSIGFVVASFAKTEESGNALTQIINFPMMFLSGIFFPVAMMPDFIRPVMDVMPLTYLGDALRQIMVSGTPMHSMSINLAVLGAWLVVTLGVSIKAFKWES